MPESQALTPQNPQPISNKTEGASRISLYPPPLFFMQCIKSKKKKRQRDWKKKKDVLQTPSKSSMGLLKEQQQQSAPPPSLEGTPSQRPALALPFPSYVPHVPRGNKQPLSYLFCLFVYFPRSSCPRSAASQT